jgi:hypothetical protein
VLSVSVCVHVDAAVLRPHGSSSQVVGGSVLGIGTWASAIRVDALSVTATAADGIDIDSLRLGDAVIVVK